MAPYPTASGSKTAPSGVAAPLIYLLLAGVSAMVQWRKWEAFHRTRNLAGSVLAVLILVAAVIYLLRAFRAKQQRGL